MRRPWPSRRSTTSRAWGHPRRRRRQTTAGRPPARSHARTHALTHSRTHARFTWREALAHCGGGLINCIVSNSSISKCDGEKPLRRR
eukprot:6211258-Pleurochrysis_carterae.AAC.2